MTKTLHETLWNSIDQQEGKDGCWMWTGSYTNSYPRVYYGKKLLPASREVYKMVHGVEVPKGKFLVNQCGHRKCVRPAHFRVLDHPLQDRGKVLPLPAREQRHNFGELRVFLQKELGRYEAEVETAKAGYPMERAFGRLLGATMALADVQVHLSEGHTSEEQLVALQRKWFDQAADFLALAVDNDDQPQGYRHINIGLAFREAGQEAKRLAGEAAETAPLALKQNEVLRKKSA